MKLINYNLDEIKTVLSALQKETQALWGKMTASQMLNHLIDIAQISNGKIVVEFANKDVPLAKMRHILYKDVPFPKEFAAPAQVEAMISNANNNNLDQLKQNLIEELNEMEAHFDSDDKTVINAVFGPLNLDDWKWFHRKHISHHLAQFGLWEY